MKINIYRGMLALVASIFFFTCNSHAQGSASNYPQGYELLCPAGSNPLTQNSTWNASTQRWRANVCMDGNGIITNQGNLSNQTYCNTSLNAAAASVTSPGAIIVPLGSVCPVTSNLTIPSTVSLIVYSPSLIAISSGVTLTINGPFTAPPASVFSYSIPTVATISTTSEAGSLVTVTTAAPHGFSNGQSVLIQNVTVAGYNIFAAPISGVGSTTFQFTDSNTGLGASSLGTAQALPVTFGTSAIGAGVNELWFPGADIGARINNAFSALPTYQQLPNNVYESSPMFSGNVNITETGTVTQTTLIDIRSHRVRLIGPGRNVLTINTSLTAASIRVTDNVFGNYGYGAEIRGLTLNAVSPGANSVGIEAGDMWGLRLTDLNVYGFTGANGVGIWFNNGQLGACASIGINCGFIENGLYQDINLYNNTNGWRFSNTTGANAGFSYGYNHWYRIHILEPTGGIAWHIDGNSNLNITPTIYHSTLLQIACEPFNSSVVAFTCFKLDANAIMADNFYTFSAENTFGGPNNTPLDLGNNSALTGTGSMEFFSSIAPVFGGTGTVFNVSGRVVVTGATWGNACIATQVVISAGWGTTANIGNCDGTWENFHLRIFGNAGGQAANPTITINFPQTNHTPSNFFTWRQPPETQCTMGGTGGVGNPSTTFNWNNSQTISQIVLTSLFTPVSGGIYDVTCYFKAR